MLYEWRRGPRSANELADQEALLPAEKAIAFGPEDAVRAGAIYRSVRAPRGRELDLAIAACAIERDATLWTLNVRDFADIPGLSVAMPRA